MAVRRTSSSKSAPAQKSKGQSRPKPVKAVPVGPIPHSKTLANGQPRPTKRSK